MRKTFVPLLLLFLLLAVPAVAQEATDQDACTTVSEDDKRCKTGVTIYTGVVIDSFAAEELNKYVNPNDANEVKSSFIAGVNVEQYVGGRTWLYLETVNGVRSTDVDCGATPQLEVCLDNDPDNDPQTNNQFFYILRNARTLEAFAGVRHELPASPTTNGRFYGKSQLGFIDVAGAGKDIVDNFIYLAGGFTTADTYFEGSYLEVGLGKNDIFSTGGNRRVKFDGFLTAPFGGPNSLANWFMQMTVDSDFRSGPDSIQIYVGFDLDLRRFTLNPGGS
ncbi:MAG TPA: hypothetical protein VHL59_16625 [Thermoanaerobaculia bacterium]|nr:hypothetical protein [Thermoanaerobaculia bacterium]